MAPKKGHYSGSGDGSELNDKSHVNRNPNPEMDRLVKPVNELRNLFSRLERPLDLGLPRIVAIGGQSSGKSSTIENFVGRDFLPRGSGLVTRRPLVLHLVNNEGSEDEREYGVFDHKREEKFYNFDDILDEIVAETDRTTAKGEISEAEIILTLYSPDYVDVSLVDMPGVVRLRLDGQSENIVDTIHNLNEKYVNDKNTIIMAVSVANADLATSDAMAFVKKYDPKGERSVGVLTKLDLVDQGTEKEKRKILLNNNDNDCHLELGWIGLVNRGQKAIDKGENITEARKYEEEYFNESPFYSDMAKEMGSKYLQKYLAQILQQKVKEALPKVKDDIKNGLDITKNKLKLLPKKLEPKEMEMKMDALLDDFKKAFQENIRGGDHVSITEKSAGAKISTIFVDGYKMYLDQVSLEENIIDHIKIAIENTNGAQKGYFPPNSAVMAVIKSQIEKFSKPSSKCFDDISRELKGTLTNVANNILKMYPNLSYVVEKRTHSKLESLEVNARALFKDCVKLEKSYINFQHPDFIGFENLAKYVKLGKLEIKLINDRDLNKQAMNILPANANPALQRKAFYVLATEERVEFYGYDLTCCFWFARFDTDKQKEKRSRGEQLTEQENFQFGETEADNTITLANAAFSSLFHGGNYIRFKFENPEDQKEWKEIFVTKSNAQATSERKQLAHIFMLVVSYKKILNTIFLDRLPKTVMQKIVDEMDTFLQKELPYEIRKLDVEDMMCMSLDDHKKVVELTSQKKAYKEAMKILDTMNFFEVSK